MRQKHPNKSFFYFLFASFIAVTATGCDKFSSPPPVTTRPEAVAKFQKIIKEEYNIPTVVRDMDNTVWIYVPLEESILELKAKPKDSLQDNPSPHPQKKMALNFLKVTYANNAFNINYAIAPAKSYGAGADPGFQNVYPESFQTKQRQVVGAIGQAFLDMDVIPGDVKYDDAQKQMTHENLVKAYVKPGTPPEIFVVVFADIVRGIKMVNTTHFRDLKSVMSVTAPMPQDEYSKRYLTEVTGDESLIGDKAGDHIQYRDIPMSEFLARQIEQRINMKYQQGDASPDADAVKVILPIVSETIQAYEFSNFTMVNLHDLESDKTLAFEPSQLNTFQQ